MSEENVAGVPRPPIAITPRWVYARAGTGTGDGVGAYR
jgi:hypothetical protein